VTDPLGTKSRELESKIRQTNNFIAVQETSGVADLPFPEDYTSAPGKKKKAEEMPRPFALACPEAGGNGPTPGLKKEGDARGARVFCIDYNPEVKSSHRQSSYGKRLCNGQKGGSS
jgi:hypothetical protein